MFHSKREHSCMCLGSSQFFIKIYFWVPACRFLLIIYYIVFTCSKAHKYNFIEGVFKIT